MPQPTAKNVPPIAKSVPAVSTTKIARHRASSKPDSFGPPPVIKGENVEAFQDMWGKLRDAISPADFLEELWAREMAELTWEIWRMRRQRSNLLEAMRPTGLKALWRSVFPLHLQVDQLTEKWAKGELSARTEVERTLNQMGLDLTAIDSYTIAVNIEKFDKIDVMIARIEARRQMINQDMRRQREFALRCKLACQSILDAEFSDAPGEASA